MRNDKMLLFLHIFLLVPIMIFSLFYAHFTLFHTIIVVLLFLLVLYNLYRFTQKHTILYRPILLTFVGSFLLYGLTQLGTLSSPNTFEILKIPNNITTFKFQNPSAIDKVCYYVGIDYNSFSFEYFDGNKWNTFYRYQKDYPFSFKWNCKKVSIPHTSQILLRPVKNKKLLWSTDNDLMLGEVRFMYKNRTVPYITNKNYLHDEPHIIIDKTYYGGAFFDEIYFARTAYEIIHNLPIYENTHPYLGKYIIALGIKLFDMTPFGWRFTNIIFATLLIFVAYYMALTLFKEPLYAYAVALLTTYSFMHFTQSRLALIDTFGVVFVYISFYYLYQFITQQKLTLLLWSGIFFGLSISVKWSAVFASLGFLFIAAYLLISRYPLQKRFSGLHLIFYGLLSYFILAPTIYLLSFFDIFIHGGTLQSVINYNLNMYNYHSTLIASHPYASPWWSWPLDLKPIGYYTQYHGDLKSSINSFGNPAIFWTGILAILYLLFTLFRRKTLEASFILLAFLGLYIPYIFIGRLMFIYHFYYAVPFLILAIVYMFKDMISKIPALHYILWIYLLIVVGLFLLFYPVLSGYEVPKSYIENYLIWLPKWWL